MVGLRRACRKQVIIGTDHQYSVIVRMSDTSLQQTDVLDTAAISELHDMLGDDFAEIVEQFVDQLNEQSCAIEQALAAGNPTALVAAAHSLKGSAGNIGVLRLSMVCAGIEKAARAQDMDAAIALQPLLAPTCAASREALLAAGYDRRS